MSIPKFRDAVKVEWRHNDLTMQSEVTVSYSVHRRACINDYKSTPELCEWLEDTTIGRLQLEVHESAVGEAYETPLDSALGGICESCGAWYEGHIAGRSIEKFRYCPGCGRRLIRL